MVLKCDVICEGGGGGERREGRGEGSIDIVRSNSTTVHNFIE